MLINVKKAPSQIIVIVLYVKHMVVTKSNRSTSKPVSTKIFCTPVRIMSCNKPVVFSPVYKFLRTSNSRISKTVCCSISCKLVSALISTEPVKSFVTCKSICFSNVSIGKNLNSVNYCSVTCTELPENVTSSAVRKSVVSCRAACPVEFETKRHSFVHLPSCLLQNTSLRYSHSHFDFGNSIRFSKVTCNILDLLIAIIGFITNFGIKNTIPINTTIITAITNTTIRIITTISFGQTITIISIIAILNINNTVIILFTIIIIISTPSPSASTSQPTFLSPSKPSASSVPPSLLPPQPLNHCPSPLRKSASRNHYYEYNGVSLQTILTQKKVLVKISQILQENTCVKVLRRDSNTGAFL